MHKCIVAIHQPNFFPWLGYFDKIRRADHFILLDNVQFPKTGSGVWTNRVKILQDLKDRWLTAPIDRNYSGVRTINEMRFAPGDPWRQKAVKSLKAAYTNAACFNDIMAVIEPLITNPTDNIAEYNIHAISALSRLLGYNGKPWSRSSALNVTTTSTLRLVDLVKAVGGTHYLCGGGAQTYQEDRIFEEAGIGLLYQKFQPASYNQASSTEFVAGLSIIDALMHTGIDGIRTMLDL
jgi:hypothetical protein